MKVSHRLEKDTQHICDKNLVTKIQKELLKSNNKEKVNPIFEMEKMFKYIKRIYKFLYAYGNLLNIINVRKMQFKTMTHYCTLTRMAKIRNKTHYTKF